VETKPPACCICHRVLRRQPWKNYGIGPKCAKLNPETFASIKAQQEYQQHELPHLQQTD
jgi:hypothetical protein